jgi:hypothetical protein
MIRSRPCAGRNSEFERMGLQIGFHATANVDAVTRWTSICDIVPAPLALGRTLWGEPM